MERLQEELDSLLAQLPEEPEIRDRLNTLVSVYPFNEYEYIIATLLAKDVLSLDDYHELRDSYIHRNLFLYIRYWVLSSREVETNPYYSHGQHRGNVGEGQLRVRHDNIRILPAMK